MSYIIEQTDILVRVLERAIQLPDYRLAGYAANAEFWVEEVFRCRKLLDGYKERFERMKLGTEEYLQEHPVKIHPYLTDEGRAGDIDAPMTSTDPRVTRGTKDSEIREAKRRLNEATERFIERLIAIGVLSEDAGEVFSPKFNRENRRARRKECQI